MQKCIMRWKCRVYHFSTCNTVRELNIVYENFKKIYMVFCSIIFVRLFKNGDT